jgi:hypothetical protein
MKTIKKTTLIAAITAMAAFAVPSMASAAVWGPINTNQSLDLAPGAVGYQGSGISWSCSGHHLGLHVRTPASSTIDVTSASWSGCFGTSGWAGCSITMAPTGLPWTGTGSLTNTSITEHILITFGASCPWGGGTAPIDGTLTHGVWTASTHSLGHSVASGLAIMGTPLVVSDSMKNATQTLTLT